jgi:hypothetical protein
VRPEVTTRISRDATDDKFLECAVSGDADYIVSADADLLILREVQASRSSTCPRSGRSSPKSETDEEHTSLAAPLARSRRGAREAKADRAKRHRRMTFGRAAVPGAVPGAALGVWRGGWGRAAVGSDGPHQATENGSLRER